MRLQRLHFQKVGLWGTPIAIDLDARLTIILGDNEAGKSTAMRAIDALFFGVNRSLAAPLSEAQFHAGAEAILPNGLPLQWTRRGRKLFVEPPMGERFEAALPAHQRARFRSIFHLGHAEIGGGPELLGADGALGSIIYAASTGVNVSLVDSLQASLSTRLKEVSGRAQRHQGINLLLPLLVDKERELREAVRFGDYEAAQAELEAIVEELEENENIREDRERELASLRQRIAWAERDAERRALMEGLRAHLGDRALPDPHRVARLLSAWDGLKRAKRTFEDRAEARSASENERLALGDEPKLALYADEIASMAQRAERAQKDRASLGTLHARLDESRRKLRQTLGLSADLPLDALLERARETILDDALRASLKRDFAELDAAHAERLQAERTLDERMREHARLPEIPAQLRITPLEQAEALLSKLAEHEREENAHRTELEKLRRQMAGLVEKLGLGELSDEQMRRLNIAPRTLLEQRRAAKIEAAEALERAVIDVRRLQNDLADRERSLEEAERGLGMIPTDEALETARSEREAAWSSLRNAIARAEADVDDRLQRFEQAMRRVDRLMDLRFEGATRLGEIVERRREVERQAALLPRAIEAKEASEKAASEADARWIELWPFLAAPPSDHARWLEDFEALRQAWVEEERLSKLAHEAAAAAENHLGDVHRILRGALPDALGLNTSAAIAQTIKSELDRRRAHNAAAEKLQDRARSLDEAIETAKDALDRAKDRLKNAEDTWEERISELPLSARGDQESIRATLERQENLQLLVAAIEDARADSSRLERSLGRFEEEAKALLKKTEAFTETLNLPRELSLEATLQVLQREAKKAVELARAIEQAETKLEQHRIAEAQAKASLDSIEKNLDALWAELGAQEEPSDESVERTAEWAREAQHLASLLRKAEDELARMSAPPLDSESDRSPTALQEEASDLEERIQALGIQRGELRERQKRAQAELERLADSDPLSIAEEREELRELILSRAQEIATLHTALFLLNRAKERAEGAAEPIIEQASDVFRRLTEGRYQGLLLGQGEDAPLEAITSDGRAIKLDALSDGTRDQIWLALRLATALRAHEETPLPLILDDVLVHFDESRTAAALEVFAELSERVQIILFTHHDHVAHRAAETIPGRHSLRILPRPEPSAQQSAHQLGQPFGRRLSESRPALERPEEIPARMLDAPRPRQRRGELLTDEEYERVLEILSTEPDREFTKGEIVEYASSLNIELSDDVWRAIANRMKDDDRIAITGRAKATRYRFRAAAGF